VEGLFIAHSIPLQEHIMTTTTDLHAAQIELENEAMGLGIQSYYKQKQEANGSEANLPPGMQLIKASIEPTAAAIEKFIEDGLAGAASRAVGVIRYMDQFPDRNMLAYVTAQAVFNHMGRMATLQAASLAVSVALEDCLNFDALKEAEPKLYKQLLKKIQHSSDDRHRHIVLRVQQKFAGVKAIKWGISEKMRLGSTLIHLFAEATGLVQVIKYHRGTNDTPEILQPTEETLKWLDEAHARCALLTPPWMPMLVKPLPWTSPFGGGYLTKQLRFPLIKTANRNYLEDLKQHQMPLVYKAVNALQETPWAINKRILDVMREVWDGGGRLGKLPSRDKTELPPKNFDEENPEPELLKEWKKKAALVYEENIRMRSKRAGMSSKLWLAEKFEVRDRFYFVHNLDWRGRAYPMATYLNPQGGDADKALLQFADGVPLGEHGARWLAIHGANTFGVDKVSFDDRLKWVEDHQGQILEAAINPLDGSRWWADADSPYMFLAFCFEWAALFMHVRAGNERATFVSQLPCSWDGTCNGLQNFSALLRDEVGGAVVGLVPTDKPCDIYTAVAQASQSLIDQEAAEGVELAKKWMGRMSRKLAKPNTMTVPYGATKRGMAGQIESVFQKMADEAHSNGSALDFTFNLFDCQYIADKNYTAIGNVVVAARLAMDWLRDAAKVAASDGLPIRWVTPSGLLVLQDYREYFGKDLDFEIAGKRRRMMLKLEGDKLDRRKQSAGISPNFVHSLDAAHMMRTVDLCLNAGVTSFAMIHDSYGAHAGHAEGLRFNLRRAFVDQYSQEVLKDFRDQLAAQLTPELAAELPPLPPMGALDLERVMDSEYFFA
jgi:DNA-directed RNA polymerase